MFFQKHWPVDGFSSAIFHVLFRSDLLMANFKSFPQSYTRRPFVLARRKKSSCSATFSVGSQIVPWSMVSSFELKEHSEQCPS